MNRTKRSTPAALFASAGLALTAYANPPTSPQGATVVAGSATINHTGNTTNIANTNGTIINWNSFNIGAGNTVRFNQASATSRVLNRVTGGNPSQIAGSLTSNGIVYLTNSAGIFIANGAVINVAGFAAAAGNISNADFIGGRNHFTNVSGAVENRGTIEAAAAHLVGQRVANYGTINAPNGMVTMTAGSDVYIAEQGGQIYARVEGAPASGGTGVTQAGEINAKGGQVRLGAGDMYAVAIDHPGRTVAKKITLQGGKGSADPNTGVVSVSGTLDASNYAAGGHGGEIKVLGDRVGVFGAGYIDASGDAGGGTVLVGGNRQGQGPEANAQATYVGKDATIKADAVSNGDGGSVVVWSDGSTKVHGDISVRGGSQSGDGGFVETSGKRALEVAKTPDITASRGRGGFWLIDPDDLTIVAGNGNVNVNQVGNVFTSNGAGAQIGVDLVVGALGGGSTVELRTGASADPLGGTITLMGGVDLDFNGVGNATLSVFADRRIVIDGRILDSVAGGDSLNLNLTADNDMNGTGNILINNTVSLGGGDFVVIRAIDFATSAAIDTGGGDFIVTLATTTGLSTLGANIDAAGGNIVFNSDVILSADLSLTGANVTFARKVDSDGTARSLAVNLTGAGSTRFFGRVGSVSALNDLTLGSAGNAGTTRINTVEITTTGDQTYNDNVILGVNVDLSAANATFARTINSDGTAHGLDVMLENGGLGRFFGTIGAGSALSTFAVDSADHAGTTRLAGTSIHTTGLQTFGQDVALVTDMTLTAGAVTFARKVDSSGAARDLTVNTSGSGETKFLGAIGAGTALANLTTNSDGRTRISGGSITAAEITFNDDVVLGADATTTGTTLVEFARTILSEPGELNDLTVVSPLTTFGGSIGIGSGTGLGRLTTDAPGMTIINSPNLIASSIDLGDKVRLGEASVWTATGSVVFRNTLDSEATEGNDLTINSPIVNFNGQVGNAAANTRFGALIVGAPGVDGGVSTLNTAIMKAARFEFQNDVILAFNLTIDSTASTTFNGTVNSRSSEFRSLTVNANSTTFSGAVGGATGGSLGTLTTDATGVTGIGAGSVTAQTVVFNDPVLLAANTTITGSTSITFNSTLNSSSGLGIDLTLNSPQTTFNGAVGKGATGALGTLVTNAAGTTTINTSDILAAEIEFRDAVLLSMDATIEGTTMVSFGSTLNSQSGEGNDLTVNSPDATFNGIVGGVAGGELGLVTTDAAGTTKILRTMEAASVVFNDSVQLGEAATPDMASVTTTGDQTYNGAVTLGQDTTLTGHHITFGLSVDSALADKSLTVDTNGSGMTVFNGPVGGINPLSSLTTNADGFTSIAGGVINTSGDQVFNDPVVLGLTTVISCNDITFMESVNSDTIARDLTINSSGNGTTTFEKAVGGMRELASLTTNSDGSLHLNGGIIQAEGDIKLDDTAVLGADTTVTGGSVTFGGSLNSDFSTRSLTVNSAGDTVFGGTVGTFAALANITTDAGGTTRILGGAVRTAGDQTYGDGVVLGSDTIITGNEVTFSSTIDSNTTATPAALTVNSVGGGITIFGGDVGGDKALKSLTTDASGTTRVGADITTTSGMTFNDVVLVYSDSVMRDMGTTGISFGNTLDSDNGNHALSLLLNTSANASAGAPAMGRISFARNVGGITAFWSLTLGGNRSTPASTATIQAGINAGTVLPSYSLLINTISGFTMGQGQKLSVLGNFTLNSGGTATLGDINTLGNMTINSPSIVLNTRPGGNVLVASGSGFTTIRDPGLDFVAGGSINFTSAPTTIGGFASPSFSTPDGSNISPNLIAFAQRASGGVSEGMMHQGATVLDLVASGPTNTNLATAIAEALPPETTGSALLTTEQPAKAQIAQLAEVGIDGRSPDVRELTDYLSGRSLYDDASANMVPNESTYIVTINRLPVRAVEDTLEAYRAVFAPEGQNETAAVSESLTAAWKDYSAQAGVNADGLGFRAYVEAVPQHAKALYYLDSLRDLFRQVGYLGLAPAELRAVKRNIMKAVTVPGMTSDQLETAIMARNMGVAMGH